MKTILKTSWQYKLVFMSFIYGSDWIPKDTLSFYCHLFVSILSLPFTWINYPINYLLHKFSTTNYKKTPPWNKWSTIGASIFLSLIFFFIGMGCLYLLKFSITGWKIFPVFELAGFVSIVGLVTLCAWIIRKIKQLSLPIEFK